MEADRSLAAGTFFALTAFLIWGLSPIYWKQLGGVAAAEILAHRIVWSAVILLVVVPLLQRRELAIALADGKSLLIAAGAGVLVGINWFVYMWSVEAERLVEASLGYYINPLVSVVLGMVFLKERLTRLQGIAFLIAAVGVVILGVRVGRFPWISVTLAGSFGFYGLVKKTGRLNSIVSLLVELVVLAPIATVFLFLVHAGSTSPIVTGMMSPESQLGGAFASGDPVQTLLLAGAGVLTIAPLLLFGGAARRIPLSRVGILQYVAPTLMLLIGTLLYGEPFTPAHVVSFTLIWLALALYTVSILKGARADRRTA
jgi:chloramphenicol-sensitive protein RarD